MLNGPLCQPDTHAGEVHSPRGTLRAGLRGMRGVRLPLTSADLIRDGVRPELLASLALGRASSGRVAKSGGDYFEWGHPLPSYLTGVFDELTETGCLALAAQDERSLQRVRLTQAGQGSGLPSRRHPAREHAPDASLYRPVLPLTKAQVQVERPQRSEDVRPEGWQLIGAMNTGVDEPIELEPEAPALRLPAGCRLSESDPRRSAPGGQPATNSLPG